MVSILNWIKGNYEWAFSGIGILGITSAISLIIFLFKRFLITADKSKAKNNIINKANKQSNIYNAGRDINIKGGK